MNQTKSQRLREGEPLTEKMLDVLHWAERVHRHNMPYGLDFECLMGTVGQWLSEDQLEPGDIVLHQDRPGVPNTLLKIDASYEGDGIELVTPEGRVLIGSARHLTRTGYKAPMLGENIDYIFSHELDSIVSTGVSGRDLGNSGRDVARITLSGQVQILVGPYWVAPYYEVPE